MTTPDDRQAAAPVGQDPRHERAFELYWSLGPKRSYGRVARSIGVSASTIKLWSRRQGWRQRIIEREVQQSRQLADSVEASPDSESARNLKIVRLAILKIAKAIAEGRVRVTMGDLDRLVRLEERITGIHGVSPKMQARAAMFLEGLQTMSVGHQKAMVRENAFDLGIIRPDGTVVPPDDSEPPPRRRRSTHSGSIWDNPKSVDENTPN